MAQQTSLGTTGPERQDAAHSFVTRLGDDPTENSLHLKKFYNIHNAW